MRIRMLFLRYVLLFACCIQLGQLAYHRIWEWSGRGGKAIGMRVRTRANRKQEDDKPFQVHLSDESFETYELDPPPYTMETTKKELKQMYYDMVSVR
jgi:hypothetical protein